MYKFVQHKGGPTETARYLRSSKTSQFQFQRDPPLRCNFQPLLERLLVLRRQLCGLYIEPKMAEVALVCESRAVDLGGIH